MPKIFGNPTRKSRPETHAPPPLSTAPRCALSPVPGIEAPLEGPLFNPLVNPLDSLKITGNRMVQCRKTSKNHRVSPNFRMFQLVPPFPFFERIWIAIAP
jgi:hypothetical protein